MPEIDLSWLGLAELAAIVSTVIALASLLLNFVLVRKQANIQIEDLKAQVDRDILSWSAGAISALSAAETSLRMAAKNKFPGEFSAKLLSNSVELSAMADHGRLFFPNLPDPFHGSHKEAAFRGLRPPILDALVFAHYAVDRVPTDPDELERVADFMWLCRRMLVSEVQKSVDPRRRTRVLADLADTTEKQQKHGFREAGGLAIHLGTIFPGILEEKDDAAWSTGYVSADDT